MQSSPALSSLVLAMVAAIGLQNGRALPEQGAVRLRSASGAGGTCMRGHRRVAG